MQFALELWEPQDMVRRIDEVLSVFEFAFAPPEDHRLRAREMFLANTRAPGYRAVATLTPDGELVAFGYGFHMHPAHSWHRNVSAALTTHDRAAWLSDCFEIAELHVRPGFQRRGIGARQLRALLAVGSGTTAMLSTVEADETQSPALRLYRRMGFVDVARNLTFHGGTRPYAILGRTLTEPLAEAPPRTAAEPASSGRSGAGRRLTPRRRLPFPPRFTPRPATR